MKLPPSCIRANSKREVARLLEYARSVPRYKESRERDALITAIDCGHTIVASGLVQAGVDPNCKDAKGKSALWHAAYWCRTKLIRELVERGAALPDDVLMGPVHDGEVEIVRFLIDRGANVNCVATYTRYSSKFPGPPKPVLTVALERVRAFDYPEALAIMLVDAGANVNRLAFTKPLYEDFVRTMLGLAAHAGLTKTVKAMIRAGADVNFPDTWGGTALLEAIGHRHREVADVLLSAGAKSNVTRKDGFTPASISRQVGFVDLAERFEREASA